MARIAGVNIPTKKRVLIALTYIYGIGSTSSKKICKEANLTSERRVADLSDDEVARIREIIDRDFIVEGDLRRQSSMDIKRYMDLGCLRGLRHRKGLPGNPFLCLKPLKPVSYTHLTLPTILRV